MAEKIWSKEFLDYENFIVNHPNYKDLPITQSEDGKYNWIAPAKSDIGKKRKEWADKKGCSLGIQSDTEGFYAKVMLSIHPTKEKPCQICGKTMSLLYYYPNSNLVKSIKKEFNYDVDKYESIRDIFQKLLLQGFSEQVFTDFLIKKCKIDESYTDFESALTVCELKCRQGLSKMLGPGSMSNFPDRYDGFHTYNRCCRSSEDKGRSKENLKSYSRDRRAYEYFSDGNIQAANKFMNSEFFNGSSADHLCPVSLGGIHDSRFLQKMPTGDNSAKRDKLVKEDVLKAIEIENKTKISAVSWYALDFLKAKINVYSIKDLEKFKNVMKQNMNNFLEILYTIKSLKDEKGTNFIVKKLIEPKKVFFEVDYIFNEDGTFTTKERHITERASEEFERIKRISFEMLEEYHNKDNRHLKPDYTEGENKIIQEICEKITQDKFSESFSLLEDLMKKIQKRELENL